MLAYYAVPFAAITAVDLELGLYATPKGRDLLVYRSSVSSAVFT